MVESETASELMNPFGFGFGFQGVARAVELSSAAAPLRGWPPIESNTPETYTFDPDTAITLAKGLQYSREQTRFAFHGVACPVEGSSAAIAVRGCRSEARRVGKGTGRR